jgi:hypothetical protein
MCISKNQGTVSSRNPACIDETGVLFLGRLLMKKSVPLKAYKYGMNVFKLCMEFGHIKWQEGRCLSICPYKRGIETLGFPTWMWKDNNYQQLLHEWKSSTNSLIVIHIFLTHYLQTGKEIHLKLTMQQGTYTTDVA